MTTPACWTTCDNNNKVIYDGDWGQCSFNYRKRVLIWDFICFLISTSLWFLINEGARLLSLQLPMLMRGIVFWFVVLLSIAVCMIVNSWLSTIMSQRVHNKVKLLHEGKNIEN